ncbi:DNA replication/repair protein RecF [Alphaproteobacteria bacterium]|nr:DNA replication/repair protein RecF [Alphaproteobacteria bacterium]
MKNSILNFRDEIQTNDYSNKFYIKKLNLKNFRNHADLNLNISKASLLLYGGNGCGKTNILEAISLLNQGKGLRKSNIEDYLNQQILFQGSYNTWGINADFICPNGKFNIGTGLKEDTVKNSRVAKINTDKCSLSSLGKILKISWITPQMCILFQTGMSERRRFIDRLTYSLDSLHLNRVYKYEKLIRQRSKILMQLNSDKTWLDTIESQISEFSVAITASRLEMVEALNDLYNKELNDNYLIDNFPPADIKLIGKIEQLLTKKPASEVEGYIKETLKKSRFSEDENIFGPHKTTIEIFNKRNNKNVNSASTGEQKLLLISIILSHTRMLNKNFNMAPILLLDDIVEHLDKKHRYALFLEVSRHEGQSWFTSTSKEAFADYPTLIDKINLPETMYRFKGKYDFQYGET